MQVYVNQHDFFINRVAQASSVDNELYIFSKSPILVSHLSDMHFSGGRISRSLMLQFLQQSQDYTNYLERSVPLLVKRRRLFRQYFPIQHMSCRFSCREYLPNLYVFTPTKSTIVDLRSFRFNNIWNNLSTKHLVSLT